MRLSAASLEAGYRLISLGATGSTNDDASRAARQGDPGRLWIVAEEQHAGRGRHGRRWTSPAGNLYASLLLVDPCEPPVSPQLGYVAGLALYEAVERLYGIAHPRLALKWPNDLLLDGGKLAGLLLEAHAIDGRLAVVIGFGVNLAEAPSGTPYPTARLRAIRADVDRADLFEELSRSFAGIFAAVSTARHPQRSDRFAGVRSLWLERAAGLGGEVSLRLPAGVRCGRFLGLDSAGRLQLSTDRGLELIDAGDLYLADQGAPAQATSVSLD